VSHQSPICTLRVCLEYLHHNLRGRESHESRHCIKLKYSHHKDALLAGVKDFHFYTILRRKKNCM
jgi:hypothetical protein